MGSRQPLRLASSGSCRRNRKQRRMGFKPVSYAGPRWFDSIPLLPLQPNSRLSRCRCVTDTTVASVAREGQLRGTGNGPVIQRIVAPAGVSLRYVAKRLESDSLADASFRRQGCNETDLDNLGCRRSLAVMLRRCLALVRRTNWMNLRGFDKLLRAILLPITMLAISAAGQLSSFADPN